MRLHDPLSFGGVVQMKFVFNFNIKNTIQSPYVYFVELSHGVTLPRHLSLFELITDRVLFTTNLSIFLKNLISEYL